MRGHHTLVAARHGTRLDRLEAPQAAVEIGDDPAPAAETRRDLAMPRILGMRVDAVGVGLPGFEQHVLHWCAGAVIDEALDADALAGHAGAGDGLAEFLAIDVEARRARRQADMDIGTGGLGGGFLEIGQSLDHDQLPSRRFSNRVERRPRSTMSNL